jgi:hypothetical protein
MVESPTLLSIESELVQLKGEAVVLLEATLEAFSGLVMHGSLSQC